jgi:hypothetical protein
MFYRQTGLSKPDKELMIFGFLRDVWNKSAETTKDVII